MAPNLIAVHLYDIQIGCLNTSLRLVSHQAMYIHVGFIDKSSYVRFIDSV